MKLSIVIPAHNEEPNLEHMVRLLFTHFDPHIHELIVINDCSTDNTRSILNTLAKNTSRIKPIHRKGIPGVGLAMRAGLARVSHTSDAVLMLDCDFVDNVQNIKTMIKTFQGTQGFLGSRYILGSKLIDYPVAKKVANRAFHALLAPLLGISQADVTNNFKLYPKKIITAIHPLLTSTGFSINAELGIYPLVLGYKLKEIPVSWKGRTAAMGTSSFRILSAGPGYVRILGRAILLRWGLLGKIV